MTAYAAHAAAASPGAGGNGQFYFPAFPAGASSDFGGWPGGGGYVPDFAYPAYDAPSAVDHRTPGSWVDLGAEQALTDDDGFSSSATEEDLTYLAADIQTYTSNIPDRQREDVLWQEYVLARARWRTFANKAPRGRRR